MKKLSLSKVETKRKVRADFDKSQPITVNVSGCTKDVKKQVIQAFFDVGLFWGTDDRELSPTDFVNNYGNVSTGGENLHRLMWGGVAKGVTPEQFFAMVYEDDPQGHPHAGLMMAYAEDAKTHAEPWKLWVVSGVKGHWDVLLTNPKWDFDMEYRRKPKTHLVHGVEVPDLRIKPSMRERYYAPYVSSEDLVIDLKNYDDGVDMHHKRFNLCYEYTEAGKQAAILHAKAMLGIE